MREYTSDCDGATTWGMKCIVLHLNPSQYLSSLLISTDDEDMIVIKCWPSWCMTVSTAAWLNTDWLSSRVPVPVLCPVVLSHHAEVAASSWYIYISWYIGWYIGWYQNYSTTEQALSEWIILNNQLYSFSLQICNTSDWLELYFPVTASSLHSPSDPVTRVVLYKQNEWEKRRYFQFSCLQRIRITFIIFIHIFIILVRNGKFLFTWQMTSLSRWNTQYSLSQEWGKILILTTFQWYAARKTRCLL